MLILILQTWSFAFGYDIIVIMEGTDVSQGILDRVSRGYYFRIFGKGGVINGLRRTIPADGAAKPAAPDLKSAADQIKADEAALKSE